MRAADYRYSFFIDDDDDIDLNTTKNLLKTRGERYGKFSDVAKITKSLEKIIEGTSQWGVSTDCQKLAAQMIVQKLARAFNGDVNYLDNRDDIAAYAQLVSLELKNGK